jgi:hypothetical protein
MTKKNEKAGSDPGLFCLHRCGRVVPRMQRSAPLFRGVVRC